MRTTREILGMMRVVAAFPVCVALFAAAAPAGGGAQSNPDTQLRRHIEINRLTGDPRAGRNFPSISDPLAILGRDLFFSKALSGDKDVACASCHHPLLGGGDGLSLPVGVGAADEDVIGPGRRPGARDAGRGPNTPRNSQSVFNVALYERFMFHDGRVEFLATGAGDAGAGIITPDSLLRTVDNAAGRDLVAAQARFPVTSQEEMQGHAFEKYSRRNRIRQHLQARLGNYGTGRGELRKNRWLGRFRTAFDKPRETAKRLITFDNIARAIAVYERSQLFVNTPWKDYVAGDNSAIGAAAKRGALLFFRPIGRNGANCASCHRGDFFTDEKFHALATPQIGRGKSNGKYGDNDFGRFKVSRNPDDKFAFRTPTLLNVAVTGPYSHAGAYQTLGEIVRHHLDPVGAIDAYDFSLGKLTQFANTGFIYEHARENTYQALRTMLDRLRQARRPVGKIVMTDRQISDIVAFLKSLTDPCVEDSRCMAPWLPDPSQSGPDGLQLNAKLRRPDDR